MCYRIFHKHEKSHDWQQVTSLSSLQGALGQLETLTHGPNSYGKWVVRNTRGELIAKVTVTRETQPCPYWSAAQLDAS